MDQEEMSVSTCGRTLPLQRRPPTLEEAGPGLPADLTVSLGRGRHSSRGQTHLQGWDPPGTRAAAAARETQENHLSPRNGSGQPGRLLIPSLGMGGQHLRAHGKNSCPATKRRGGVEGTEPRILQNIRVEQDVSCHQV